MVLAHVPAQAAVLDLRVVADLGPRPHVRPRPQVRERPDRDVVLHGGSLDDAGPDRAPLPDDGVVDLRPARDAGPGTDRGPAAEDHVRLQHDVLGEHHRVIQVHRGRIHHRDPGPHPAVVGLHPHVPFGAGELRPIVDPGQASVVVHVQAGHDPPVLAREPHQVREVQLARDGRRAQVADPAAEPRRVDGVQAGVDLADLELLLGGVLLLHDPLHGAALVPHHAPEPGRVDGGDGDQRDGGMVHGPRLEQRRQELRIHQRHVAGEDQHVLDVVVERGQGGPQGITRAAGNILDGGVRDRGDGVADPLRGRRPDDQRPGPGGLDRRVQDVLDHRTAAERVQDLGQGGLHPRAEARREHDRDRAPPGYAGARGGHGVERCADRVQAAAGGAAASPVGRCLVVMRGGQILRAVGTRVKRDRDRRPAAGPIGGVGGLGGHRAGAGRAPCRRRRGTCHGAPYGWPRAAPRVRRGRVSPRPPLSGVRSPRSPPGRPWAARRRPPWSGRAEDPA